MVLSFPQRIARQTLRITQPVNPFHQRTQERMLNVVCAVNQVFFDVIFSTHLCNFLMIAFIHAIGASVLAWTFVVMIYLFAEEICDFVLDRLRERFPNNYMAGVEFERKRRSRIVDANLATFLVKHDDNGGMSLGWVNTFLKLIVSGSDVEMWCDEPCNNEETSGCGGPIRQFITRELPPFINLFVDKTFQEIPSLKKIAFLRPQISTLDILANPPWIGNFELHEWTSSVQTCTRGRVCTMLDLKLRDSPVLRGTVCCILPFTIEFFHLIVKLEVKLGPFLDSKKMIGKVKVSLLEQPELAYEFGGILRFLNLRIIRIPLWQVARWCLKRVMVYPNSITIDLVDDIEDHQVAPAEPIGILDIRPIDMRKPKQSCKNFNVIVRLGKCQIGQFKCEKKKKRLTVTNEDIVHLPVTQDDIDNDSAITFEVHCGSNPAIEYTDERPLSSIDLLLKDAIKTRDVWSREFDREDGNLKIEMKFLPFQACSIEKCLESNTESIISLLVISLTTEKNMYKQLSIQAPARPPYLTAVGRPDKMVWTFNEVFHLAIFKPRSDRVHLSLYQVNVPIEREEDWPQIPIAAFPTELCGTISLRLTEFTGKRQILRGDGFSITVIGRHSNLVHQDSSDEKSI